MIREAVPLLFQLEVLCKLIVKLVSSHQEQLGAGSLWPKAPRPLACANRTGPRVHPHAPLQQAQTKSGGQKRAAASQSERGSPEGSRQARLCRTSWEETESYKLDVLRKLK